MIQSFKVEGDDVASIESALKAVDAATTKLRLAESEFEALRLRFCAAAGVNADHFTPVYDPENGWELRRVRREA